MRGEAHHPLTGGRFLYVQQRSCKRTATSSRQQKQQQHGCFLKRSIRWRGLGCGSERRTYFVPASPNFWRLRNPGSGLNTAFAGFAGVLLAVAGDVHSHVSGPGGSATAGVQQAAAHGACVWCAASVMCSIVHALAVSCSSRRILQPLYVPFMSVCV